MKNIKRILLSVLVVATLVMSLAVTSCGKCNHSFGEWEATGESTCSGTAEKRVCSKCGEEESRTNGDLTAHAWGEWSVKTAATCTTAGEKVRACTACTAKDSAIIEAEGHVGALICEKCYGATAAIPDIDFSSYRSIGIDITGVTINVDEYNEFVNSGIISIEASEGYVGLDDNDELIGAGKATLKFDSTHAPLNNTMIISFFIEGDAIYMAADGSTLLSSTDKSENRYFKLNVAASPELEEAEAALAELEALYPEIEAWYNDVFAPIFDSVSIDTSAADALVAKAVNSLIKRNVANDGSYTLTIDFDAIKEFNEKLATEKISALIDIILGEGVYADLKSYVTDDEFYSLSVADLVNYLETEQNISITALFDAIDALLVTVTGAEGITLEALIASNEDMGIELPEGFDIAEFLTGEEMTEYTVMAALKSIFGVEDDPETEDADEAAVAVKDIVDGLFTQLESVTLYEVILAYGAEPVSEEQDPVRETADEINGIIDMIAESFSFTVSFDTNGDFVSTVVGICVPEENIDLTLTLTEADATLVCDVTVDVPDTVDVNAEIKIVPDMTVAADAAKLASIKAAIATVPEIPENVFFEAAREDIIYNENFVYYVEDGVLYLLMIEDVEVADGGATVSTVAYKVPYTDEYVSLVVTEGCENVMELLLDVTTYSATGSFDALLATEYTKEYIKANFLDTVGEIKAVIETVPPEAWEASLDNFVLRYNSETEEFAYGYEDSLTSGNETIHYNGHVYEMDEAKSNEPEECADVGNIHYVCSICGDEYDYYYSYGHDYDAEYVLKDTALGLDGGFKKLDVCAICGEESDVYDYDILVDSELPAAYYEVEDEVCAAFKITVTEAGAYTICTDSETDSDCDTAIILWSLVEGELTQLEYVDDGSHETLTIELNAGEYVIGVKNWYVNADAYTVYVNAAVAE